jgi:hypothetical protein
MPGTELLANPEERVHLLYLRIIISTVRDSFFNVTFNHFLAELYTPIKNIPPSSYVTIFCIIYSKVTEIKIYTYTMRETGMKVILLNHLCSSEVHISPSTFQVSLVKSRLYLVIFLG